MIVKIILGSHLFMIFLLALVKKNGVILEDTPTLLAKTKQIGLF
ncbi:MAG: hypothetical protein WH035_06690 [Spirochaetota bacterium]